MKSWWLVAFGCVCGLLGAGVLVLVSRSPPGEAVRLLPPPTAAPLLVYVSGAVEKPGVYALPQGSRVSDAIQSAGGLIPEGDDRLLNLAAPLQDGGRVIVPLKSEGSERLPDQDGVEGLYSLVDINTATQAELEALPGIGPVIAQKIIAYRDQYGPFEAVEDLMNVSGIGQGIFQQIHAMIYLGDAP